jgi:hypothetical protein
MMKPGLHNLLIANSSLMSKSSVVVKNNGIMNHRHTQYDLIARPVRPAFKTTLYTIYKDKANERYDDHLVQTVGEEKGEPSLKFATDWEELKLTYEEDMPQVKKLNSFRRRLNIWLA